MERELEKASFLNNIEWPLSQPLGAARPVAAAITDAFVTRVRLGGKRPPKRRRLIAKCQAVCYYK